MRSARGAPPPSPSLTGEGLGVQANAPKVDGTAVRADFNAPVCVEHYARATQTVGLWAAERLLFTRVFPSPLRLLEAGCGTGRVTLGLWEMGHADLTAFDFAEGLLERARRAAAEAGAETIRFFHADATRLDETPELGTGFQGVLFAFNGLMQIPGRENRRAALRGLAQRCVPQAPIVFTTHDRDASPTDRLRWREEAERWSRGAQDPRLLEFGDRWFEDDASGRIFMHLPDRREILEDLASTGWHHQEDHLRSELAEESARVEAFSDECRFWVARRA